MRKNCHGVRNNAACTLLVQVNVNKDERKPKVDEDFRWMVAREAPHLRRFAISLTGDVERGDDLVQDTVERALRKHRLWRRSGSIRGWLFKVLYRVYLNQRERGRVERNAMALMEQGAAQSVPAGQEGHLEMLDIGAALQALPSDQREAVLLVGLEGMAYDEAADVLGVPIGTLKSRLFRGREALWTVRKGERASNLRRIK